MEIRFGIHRGYEEAREEAANYEQARTQSDRDYEEAAGAVATKKPLSADEEAELSRLWKKLVKLYHPDRFANEPEKLELEIIDVLESLNRLRESPDYALCRLSEQKPGVLEALAAKRAKLLEKKTADLEAAAKRMAEEIAELSGAPPEPSA